MPERRILLLITDLEIGGTPTVVRELALRLKRAVGERASIEVACLGRWGPVVSQLHAAGVPVTTLAARAIAVVKFLNSQGISNDHLVAAGYGEYQPLSMMDTARNRRIELKLTNR